MNQINIKNLIRQGIGNRQDLEIIFHQDKEHHRLPISIINGKEKGKTVALIAGIHGYEYPPIIALQDILKEITPHNLKGSLIIIPIANIGSFYKRTPFIHPDDQKNLNLCFPGNYSGSITEQIAYWITQNIIPNTDIFIDLHGGDANEDLIPFSCYYNNENNRENTQIAKKLCEVSNLPFIVSFPYTISSTEPALYAFKQAVQDNIIGLSLEAGKLGNLQNDCVTILKQAIYNMLNFTNLHPNITHKAEKQTFLNRQDYIKASEQGIFYSHHKSGNFIRQGEKLGYITDIFGNILEEIFSPCSGIILYKIGTPPVNKNETLFCIGYYS